MKKSKNIEKNRKRFLKAKILSVVAILTMSCAVGLTAFAKGDADGAWNEVMETIFDWIPAIAAVLIVIGGVEFGFAFKSEDAEGKTKALRTVAAGAIVAGICAGLKTYAKLDGDTKTTSPTATSAIHRIIDINT